MAKQTKNYEELKPFVPNNGNEENYALLTHYLQMEDTTDKENKFNELVNKHGFSGYKISQAERWYVKEEYYNRYFFKREIKFIDLFAGIGGIRKGFEMACYKNGFTSKCVFTSEIKPYAVDVLLQNHPKEKIFGDITKIDSKEIADFDFLLAGFPCQAFSAAGKRLGFMDTRGTLFFEIERILKEKKPFGFILENVEGLVNHDRDKKADKIGRTLSTILLHLENLGYKVTWRVLDAKDFDVPQERKRIYIVGTKKEKPDLDNFEIKHKLLSDILEKGLEVSNNSFVKLVLSHYPVEKLYGMSIKDKRGGDNNIHSWDIEYKGSVSEEQKQLLNRLLKERRKKKWAEEYGIDWMDGMPLTIEQIRTFNFNPKLEEMLEDLVDKKYLKREYPKRRINGVRKADPTLPLGYNIVAGKMSYEIAKILNPNGIAPTLVAMDMEHLYVVDGCGLRRLTLREGLRLFGYPDDFKFNVSISDGYDLLGNTVVVPVISQVANRVLSIYKKENK